MKELKTRLEEQKRQLMNNRDKTSLDLGQTRGQLLKLAQQIELLRTQKAAMTNQVRELDLFASSLQNMLQGFQQDKRATQPAESQLVIGFTPFHIDEVESCAQTSRQAVTNARVKHATGASDVPSRGEVFGWSDHRSREGKTITFVVSKRIARTDLQEMMNKTWSICTDESRMKRVLSPSIPCRFRVLQKISDDMRIVDRTTYAMPGLTLRTVYLLLREVQTDGSHLLVMKTIDMPLVRQLLQPGETWCHIFYWIRMTPELDGTASEFGGVLTYTHELLAARWIVELVFLAVRWENLCGVANMLQL